MKISENTQQLGRAVGDIEAVKPNGNFEQIPGKIIRDYSSIGKLLNQSK